MTRITILILSLLTISGCSQNNYFTTTNLESNSLTGEYSNNDGFGNNINIKLNQDGSYESQLNGIIGLKGYSTGSWEPNAQMEQVTFIPTIESGILKGFLRPMTVIYDNRDISLIPTIKIQNHHQLMADFGKSTYSYSKNSI